MRKISSSRLAVIAVVPLLAAGGIVAASVPAWASTCTTSADNGGCGPYSSSQIYAGSNGFTDVLNNVWNPIPGWQQTLTVTDGSNWSASANMPNGNTAVVSYPDTQTVYTTANNTPDPLSDFGSSLTSSYSQTDPPGSGNDYEWAYDIWAGTGSNNGAQEIMIWTDNHGQRPAGNEISSNVAIGGQSYQVWSTSGAGQTGNPVTLVRNSQSSSGTEDLLADINWLLGNGYMPQGSGINQIDYGPELCSTGGVTETFALSNFTIISGGGGGTQQAPAVTTNAATSVTSSGAVLNGSVNPESQSTTYQFDYGTTTGYGTSVPSPAGSAGSGSSPVSESANLTGLAASTTYHYRVEATNATGTTFGADQQFTTPAAGGAVAFGAVAPGSAGQKCANCSTLGWNASVAGSNPALLAEVAVGTPDGSDGSCVVTATDNGTPMTRLSTVHDNGQPAGFSSVYGVTAPASGTNAIAFSVSGCGTPEELTGGSLTFTGASQAAPFGTAKTASGSGTAARVVTTGSTSGDMIAGFASNGSSISSAAAPATSRYRANQDAASGAGNSAGATAPATGSNVTMKWTVVSDWWGAAAVEVLHS